MRMYIKPLVLASAIVVSSFFASRAFAQDVADLTGCQSVEGNYCVVTAGKVTLQKVVGDVSILRQASTLAGTSGSDLVSGDRVVSEKGSALITLGPQCKISLVEFSSARLSSNNGLTCILLGGAATAANETSNNLLTGAAVLGGVGAAAGLLSLSSQSSGGGLPVGSP